MRRRVLVGALITAIIAVAPTSVSADTKLDDVRKERKRAATELRTLLTDIETTTSYTVTGEERIERLQEQDRDLSAQLAALQRDAKQRVRDAVKYGNVADSMVVLPVGRPQQAMERVRILSTLAHRDQAAAQSMEATLRRQASLREAIAAQVTQMRDRRAKLERTTAKVERRLEELRATEKKLEAKRRAATAGGPKSGDGAYACIQARPYSFIDSWGYARSGGRTHEGTDVMAAYGNEVYAFTNGRISRMGSSGIGGITLYLLGDDNTSYYYAHLAGFADAVTEGTRVRAGQLIAFNGDSGNAAGTPPHVHFEAHPGGGAPVNPYAMLLEACP